MLTFASGVGAQGGGSNSASGRRVPCRPRRSRRPRGRDRPCASPSARRRRGAPTACPGRCRPRRTSSRDRGSAGRTPRCGPAPARPCRCGQDSPSTPSRPSRVAKSDEILAQQAKPDRRCRPARATARSDSRRYPVAAHQRPMGASPSTRHSSSFSAVVNIANALSFGRGGRQMHRRRSRNLSLLSLFGRYRLATFMSRPGRASSVHAPCLLRRCIRDGCPSRLARVWLAF